jgi:hypothetical protein
MTKLNENYNTSALQGRQSTRKHTTTNQKEKESIDGSIDRRCELRGASGGVLYIIFGVQQIQECKKLHKYIDFINFFFSAGQPNEI